MIAGIVYGIVCTLIVSAIGVKFVSIRPVGGDYGSVLSSAWKIFLRGILGIASIVIAVFGLLLTMKSGSAAVWHTYLSWLATYAVGLTVYFHVRYGRHITK